MEYLFGPATDYVIMQRLFIKGVAICYLIAFWSMHRQVLGLYGSKGILPIPEVLTQIHQNLKEHSRWKAPSIFWAGASDGQLKGVCVAGMVISVLVLLEIVPAPLLFLLWISYLSFVSVGPVFLSFQWDFLLLEVGFIAIFFSVQAPPSMLYIFLLKLLLFRFIFSSGIVKFRSGCPEWRSLKAMDYHYLTQPIPNRVAYFMHQTVAVTGKLSAILTLLIEIVVPFFIFLPQPFPLIAFGVLVAFQFLIMLTGNYAFFNLLAIVMCLPLLNDSQLSWLFSSELMPGTISPHLMSGVFLLLIGFCLIFFNGMQLLGLFKHLGKWQNLIWMVSPFGICNHYGLFARMTTVRNEIIVEGSQDGNTWIPYEFHWKPGDLSTPPRQVAPHQPRLDWQMWFAALESYKHNFWVTRFVARLLEGSPDVLDLIKTNPFQKAPPKYIRCLLYEYHFTDVHTMRLTGEWWTRELKGNYGPTLTLKG